MVETSLVIVSGMSGAGKTTAAKVLEDLGYYTIDNIPLKIAERIAELFTAVGAAASKIALVIDARSRDEKAAFEVISMLKTRYGAKVIFLEASTDVLVNRYKENRRVHPLGADILEAVLKEEALLKEIKSISDAVVDTSDLNVHQLTERIKGFFQLSDNDIAVTVSSFGFKHGLPVDSDLVFDVRFLRNPYFDNELRGLTGLERTIQDYVERDSAFNEFFTKLTDLVLFLIPQYKKEGKHFLKISVGCTGGRHRSVAVVEKLAKYIRDNADVPVLVSHRDVERE